jgi:hypothetical protein
MNYINLLLLLLIICISFSNKTEHFNKPSLFLVRLIYQNNFQIYNLYDSDYKYKSYCDFISDFINVLNDKRNNFDMMNFEKFTKKIKQYVLLNKNLIIKNNENAQCEREYYYKIKYVIPTVDQIFVTDGFYIFLYVLFLKYRFNLTNYEINKNLDENSLNVNINNITGNIFIKMRDIIFTKEICFPEKIAGIENNNIIMNDLEERIERRNVFKNIPKVIELKLINNKFRLINAEDEFYKSNKSKSEKERMNYYINTRNFKRRLIINTTNTVNNIYMDKTLNNILSIYELENEIINARNNLTTQFNNNLDCNKLVYNKNITFNSSKIFTDKMFKCQNDRILIHFKSNPDELDNTIDINKLHYELCPSNINEKIVGKMDYFNENCSIGDIEPEYIFSKNTAYTKLPFNYWLFSNK